MRQKGFTMIEILVVIVVFGVGILAILTMLTNSIGYFDTVNMQTRATMLAKEALDLAYSHRDSNLEQGYPRNYVGYDETNNKEIVRTPLEVYKLGFSKEGYYLLEKSEKRSDFSSNFDAFRVVLEKGDGKLPSYYRYLEEKDASTDVSKGFARRVEFSTVKWGEFSTVEWGVFSPNKLLKISSHALYQRGATTGEVVLEGFIGLKDSKVEESSQTTN